MYADRLVRGIDKGARSNAHKRTGSGASFFLFQRRVYPSVSIRVYRSFAATDLGVQAQTTRAGTRAMDGEVWFAMLWFLRTAS